MSKEINEKRWGPLMYALASSFGLLYFSLLASQMSPAEGGRDLSLEKDWVGVELLAIPCSISCRPGR